MAKISLAGFKDPVSPTALHHLGGRCRPGDDRGHDPGAGGDFHPLVLRRGLPQGTGRHDHRLRAFLHSKISCMACHMPVGANPVIFLLHKAEALGELYMTVTNKFELPLNAESEVALTMKTKQCVQCHALDTRPITPSPGMKIDHAKHEEKEIPCTICHNRIAHNEDFELTLTHPTTGEPNQKHEDFMSMDACFRCHDQEPGAATGAVRRLPHGRLRAQARPAICRLNFMPRSTARWPRWRLRKLPRPEGVRSDDNDSRGQDGVVQAERGLAEEPLGEMLIPVGAVYYCGTCHKRGVLHQLPRHADAAQQGVRGARRRQGSQGHPVQSKVIPEKCVMCHGVNDKTHFCDECHHGTKVDHEFDAKKPWINQHPKAVAKSGVKACTEKCHTPKFCVDCHTRRRSFPRRTSRQTWTHPVKPSQSDYGKSDAPVKAKHALAAQDSIESCEVCHGAGGANAKFCKSCHKLEMPHHDGVQEVPRRRPAARTRACAATATASRRCAATATTWILRTACRG